MFAVLRLGTRLHQKMKRRALYRSSPTLRRSSFFCNQVFFGNIPSSSTSLLSSVDVTTRITRKVTAGAIGNTRVPSISSPCPSQGHTGGERALNRSSPLSPGTRPMLVHAMKCRNDLGPKQELARLNAILLRSSATRSSLITILLLQPVFFLRSASRPRP